MAPESGPGGAAEVDLEDLLAGCAAEPIAVPEAIQPHGVLVGVGPGGRVEVCSAGAEGLIPGLELGADAGAVLGDLARAGRALDEGEAFVDAVLLADGTLVDAVVHPSEPLVLVELEPATTTTMGADELIEHQRRLWRSDDDGALLAVLADAVRAVTGFDRVMVYRFDEEWNGEVVAEARLDELEPLLGLRYPASDIPPQARDLYRRNPMRLIADVAYLPAPLEYLDAGLAPLDLSAVGLRSVSPVHLRYLANMGVDASMSYSLLVDGELWGLVACHHHRGAHRPSLAARRAGLALAELSSALLEARRSARLLAARVGVAEVVERLGIAIASEPHQLQERLLAEPDLLALAGASGAVVKVDGPPRGVGEHPPLAVAAELVQARLAGSGGGVHADDAVGLGRAGAGLLATTVGGDVDRWVAWFRPEVVREVRWAGDPHGKEVDRASDGTLRLGPRRSFAAYTEVVAGRSRPWDEAHLWAAARVGDLVAGALAQRARVQADAGALVQRALLAETSYNVDGLDVAVSYRPAEDAPVGGDWHDVLELGRGRIALVIGDVAGHGFDAAGVMAQARTALRAYLVADPDPARALDRLGALVERLLPGQLITALLVVVDRASGALSVASAGHPPALVAGPDGHTAALGGGRRPALGIPTQSSVPAAPAMLPAGGAVVLFSDGLLERRDRSLQAELERLTNEVLPTWDGAGKVCEHLVSRMAAGAEDDVTVLVASAAKELS